MRKSSYLTRATRRFLERTNCVSPIHAVEQGKRSIEEWVDILQEEFEREKDRARTMRKTRVATRRLAAA
jgi:hypothetical protein